MTTTTQHATGTFCWPELATTDQAGARAFYTGLFTWKPRETPISEGETYTVLENGGRDAAALYTMRADQRKLGIPPHWLSYVAVENVDAATQQAATLGGKTLAGPLDVMDLGRMVVLQDPLGAMFALWQPKTHKGVGVIEEPGSLSWTELMTTDPTKARGFYGGLFGWTAEEMAMGPSIYTVYKNADRPAAGMMPITPEMGPVPPNWLPYFAVAATDAAVAKAIMAGGKVSVPPTTVPGVGRFAVLIDPQGAHFGILGPGQ
jgi:uncharacterized protein